MDSLSYLLLLLSFLLGFILMCLLPCGYSYWVAYRIAEKHKNGVVAAWLLAEAVLVLAGTLLYFHWFAYESALSHIYGREVLPTWIAGACVLLIIQTILKLIFGSHNRRYIILIIGLAILLAGALYAAVFTRGIECPACSSDTLNDGLYKFFWRLFNGTEWYPAVSASEMHS